MPSESGFEIVTGDAVLPVYPVRSRADVKRLVSRASGPFGVSCAPPGRRGASSVPLEARDGILETAVRAGIDVIVAGGEPADEEAARDEYRAHGAYVSPALVPALLRLVRMGSSVGGPLESLTTRERDVLDLVSLGLSNRAVAARLFLSEHTVRNHLSRIFRKLDVRGRREAVEFYRGSCPTGASPPAQKD